jgi:hypothetical protein
MPSLLWRLHFALPGYRLRQDLRRRAQAATRFLRPGWPLWPLAASYSMVPPTRIQFLERLASETRVPGIFMECGVAEGGTALLLGLIARRQGRKLWIFDTFEGLPAPTAADPDYDVAVTFTGTCRGELPDIQRLFERHGVWRLTTAIKGLFQETMPRLTIPPIALLHLDGDWYDSTRTCLTHLWPHVVPGGAVQFDDYGAWQGCRKAVDEFFDGQSMRVDMIDNHGAIVRKPVH